MDFNNMLEFVHDILKRNDALKPHKPNQCFRNRYEHSVRVYKWAQRLAVDFKDINLDICLTACIFHDVGYAYGKDDHAISSAKIFNEYVKDKNFDKDFIDEVEWIIINHSDKSLLQTTTNHNFIIVLEADLLDEEGALGILWDLLAAGKKDVSSYYLALEELSKHSSHILGQDMMVSKTAKMYWNSKKKLVRDFMDQIKEDLFLE